MPELSKLSFLYFSLFPELFTTYTFLLPESPAFFLYARTKEAICSISVTFSGYSIILFLLCRPQLTSPVHAAEEVLIF